MSEKILASQKNFGRILWAKKEEKLEKILAFMLGNLDMVFCFENCADLLWQKNCFSDQEKLLQNLWDHQNDLFEPWKDRTIFGAIKCKLEQIFGM